MFPGALTPTEIDAAWRAGATMVKVFPAATFGPAYLREVHGPFSHVELLACGGVNAANLGDYFANGAAAAAFGASVFRPSWLAERDFASIGGAIAELVRSFHVWREGEPARPT
jgi:2-dehydro-3-deoxyphosphogluconate aldolase/(4S)-4-hydroxy-2-oxoglutarate aldolase